MKTLWTLAILMVVLDTSSFSFSQQILIAGPELIKSGPFGRPILVMNDYQQWSVPILVYKNPDVEIFVPDITTAGWIHWNVEKFRATGTFSTRLYAFFKNDRSCRHGFIPSGHYNDPKYLEACKNIRYRVSYVAIDTRKKTATVSRAILVMKDGSQQLLPGSPATPIAKMQPGPAADINRVSEIVAREMGEYKGMSAREVVRRDAEVEKKMIEQTMTPDGQQGCPNATSEQLRNWHSTGCPPVPHP